MDAFWKLYRRLPEFNLRNVLIGLATLLGLLLISVLIYWNSLYAGMPKLPETARLWEVNREPAIEFVDNKGELLEVRGPRYGRAVRLEELPPHVPRAFIAAEDKRFYAHDGADPQAMFRAVIYNALSGKTVSGASTITQQLIKNLVLTPEQTLKRKVQEIALARALEKQASKSEILELYLNRVYLGSGFYGLGAAARFYFGKDPIDLNLAEATLLATLPQAPSRLALNSNLKDAKIRQAYVLNEMVDLGFVSRESADLAYAANVKLSVPPPRNPYLGYVLDAAVVRAGQLVPKLPDDTVITLTLDANLQKKTSISIEKRMASEGKAAKASQAGAIIMDKQGRVLAFYGGRNYSSSQFNHVTMAKRQPGSAFKPFVFAAALEAGLSPYDVRVDEPITVQGWSPRNFTPGFSGAMTLTEALRDSVNTIAVKLTQEVGVRNVVKLARNFGISTPLKPLPSLALGSQEVTLWDLTRAYGPFVNDGLRVDPYLIEKIESSRGDSLYQRGAAVPTRVFARPLARMMTSMLQTVVLSGTGRAAAIPDWPVAGKTGTSQSSRDAWFIGFTADRIAGVWTGNDDDSAMYKVTGGGLPSRLWSDIMRLATEGRPAQPLPLSGGGTHLNAKQQERLRFYRELGSAFGAVADR